MNRSTIGKAIIAVNTAASVAVICTGLNNMLLFFTAGMVVLVWADLKVNKT